MNDYDIIIIGTGAGALAQRLAPSGKRILILERGTFLPQEKENRDTTCSNGSGKNHHGATQ